MCLYSSSWLQRAVAVPLDRLRFPGHRSSLHAFAACQPCEPVGLQPLSESVLIRLPQPSRPFSNMGPGTKHPPAHQRIQEPLTGSLPHLQLTTEMDDGPGPARVAERKPRGQS